MPREKVRTRLVGARGEAAGGQRLVDHAGRSFKAVKLRRKSVDSLRRSVRRRAECCGRPFQSSLCCSERIASGHSTATPQKCDAAAGGRQSSAAMRSSVVFPAPLGPSSATNSPGTISSETPRRAISEPKRFSTSSNGFRSWCRARRKYETSRGWLKSDARMSLSLSPDRAGPSACARVLAGVVFLADRARLRAAVRA